MAFFKFRWPGQGQQAPADKPARRARAPQAESIEAMRRRARHRLIGAAVLVMAGVIGFPMLFDTQPRPIPVDIPIEIPDRNKVAPLVVPAPATPSPAVAAAPAAAPPQAAAAPGATAASAAATRSAAAHGDGLAEGEEVLTPTKPAAAKPVAAAAIAPAKPESKPEPRPEPTPAAPRPDDGARARALLEGRPAATAGAVPAPAAKGEENRFVVQVGAFADADKAREARSKVERAGVKTYTQVVDTKDGKRTRVRVGPFADRAEADRVAGRIRALDLPASVLTL